MRIDSLKVRKECDYVPSHYPGHQKLKKIRVLHGTSCSGGTGIGDLQSFELSCFKTTRVVSAVMWGSFSILRQI